MCNAQKDFDPVDAKPTGRNVLLDMHLGAALFWIGWGFSGVGPRWLYPRLIASSFVFGIFLAVSPVFSYIDTLDIWLYDTFNLPAYGILMRPLSTLVMAYIPVSCNNLRRRLFELY